MTGAMEREKYEKRTRVLGSIGGSHGWRGGGGKVRWREVREISSTSASLVAGVDHDSDGVDPPEGYEFSLKTVRSVVDIASLVPHVRALSCDVLLFLPPLARFCTLFFSVGQLTSVNVTDDGKITAPLLLISGILQSFSFPLRATLSVKRIRFTPAHSIPFLIHFPHAGSPLSHTILRRIHW
jgi:hypothetical protein